MSRTCVTPAANSGASNTADAGPTYPMRPSGRTPMAPSSSSPYGADVFAAIVATRQLVSTSAQAGWAFRVVPGAAGMGTVGICGGTAGSPAARTRAGSTKFGRVTVRPACRSISSRICSWALAFPAHERRATPLETSHESMDCERRAASSVPSITRPKPPLMTSPHPTPPPLCNATHVAPRAASPSAFWTAMSAVNAEPSYTLDVSRKGESVPDTSW